MSKIIVTCLREVQAGEKNSPFNEEYCDIPVPPGVLGKKLCRLGDAQPLSLKLTSWMRLLKPVITLFTKHTKRGEAMTKIRLDTVVTPTELYPRFGDKRLGNSVESFSG